MRLDCRYPSSTTRSGRGAAPVARARDAAAIAAAFHAEHLRLYGYSLQAEGRRSRSSTCACRRSARPSVRPIAASAGGADASAALRAGGAWIPERDAFVSVPVYDGHAMRCGHRIAGPAIVEHQTTAIFVGWDAYDCSVDALGSVRRQAPSAG